MKNAINVLLVDDQVIIRSGLKLLLNTQTQFDFQITESENGAEAIDKISKNKYDIILMDVQMPRLDGISALKTLRQKACEIPVLILTIYQDKAVIRQCIAAGADGYILKTTGIEELIKAVSTLLKGQTYFGTEVSKIIYGSNEKQERIVGVESELTRREWQVLQMFAEEKSNEEIAEALNISKRTVEGHKKNLKTKLGVKSSVGLMKFAINNGLV